MQEFVHPNMGTPKRMKMKKYYEILPYEKDEIRDSVARLCDA